MNNRIRVSVDDIYREIYVEPGELAFKIAEQYNYQPYMIQRYLQILGFDNTLKLLQAFEKRPKPVVKTNTRLISSIDLKKRLIELGFVLEEIDWIGDAYRIVKQPGSPTIGSTHEYLKGYYYVYRDSASIIPPLLLVENYKGDVLDACAAPGGKTVLLSELIGDNNTVYANDIALYRLKTLVSHLIRMKISNVKIIWSDVSKLPRLINKKFDRILLDAPCSGEGIIMLDPSRKTKTSLRDLSIIVKKEIELLNSCLEILGDNGILVYTTCSIAPEENEYVVSKIIETRNDVEVVKPSLQLFKWSSGLKSFGRIVFNQSVENCVRIWPHLHNMIGLTICILSKKRY